MKDRKKHIAGERVELAWLGGHGVAKAHALGLSAPMTELFNQLVLFGVESKISQSEGGQATTTEQQSRVP